MDNDNIIPFNKEGKTQLPDIEISAVIEESDIYLRESVVAFIIFSYSGLLFATLAVILFQGFHLWGFNLPEKFLMWLGGATIGEVGGLALIVHKSLFK